MNKDASLLPVGAYKGSGWALIVELLSVALQSGPYGSELSGVDSQTGKRKPMPLGHFFLAVDVEAMCDLDVFKTNVAEVLGVIRESTPNPKMGGKIFTPNEMEHQTSVQREENGGLEVSHILQNQMIELRNNHESLMEQYPKFPFENGEETKEG